MSSTRRLASGSFALVDDRGRVHAILGPDAQLRCPECDTYSGHFTGPDREGNLIHSTCGREAVIASFLRGTPEYEAAYEDDDDRTCEQADCGNELRADEGLEDGLCDYCAIRDDLDYGSQDEPIHEDGSYRPRVDQEDPRIAQAEYDRDHPEPDEAREWGGIDWP